MDQKHNAHSLAGRFEQVLIIFIICAQGHHLHASVGPAPAEPAPAPAPVRAPECTPHALSVRAASPVPVTQIYVQTKKVRDQIGT